MTVRMQPEEFVSTRSMSWAPLSPGIRMKVLRLSPESGTWTVLFHADAGASFARHRHLAPGEYFMLSGKMEVRGGVQAGGTTAVTGDYGWEPVSVIHDHTYFPEESEFLFTNHGAVQFVDEQGNTTGVLDWEAIQSLAQVASARAA
jgi:acetylacetone-cleaving enzyme